MKRRTLLAVAALAAMVFVGCGGGGGSSLPTSTEEVLQGTFELRQIRVTGEGTDVTVKPPVATGTVVVTPDGRFTATIDMPTGGVSGIWSGTYSVEGNVLTLYYDDGGIEEWTISDDRTVVSSIITEDGLNIYPTYTLA